MNIFYAKTYTVVSGRLHREIGVVVNADQVAYLADANEWDPEDYPKGVTRIGLSNGSVLFVKGTLPDITEKVTRCENLLE